AESVLRARWQLHALSISPAANARRQQRLSPVFATRDGSNCHRVGPWLLLQHRAAGEMSPARLANRRGAGELVRAHARLKPLPGIALAAGLSALVCLCIRHDLSQATGADGAVKVVHAQADMDGNYGRRLAED